jgi:hypothetical protein
MTCRCSPSQYVGPARYLDPPCPVSMLPDIHVCCISHDHCKSWRWYRLVFYEEFGADEIQTIIWTTTPFLTCGSFTKTRSISSSR